MTYREFQVIVEDTFTTYLNVELERIKARVIGSALPFLFPKTIRFIESDSHYAADILGSRKAPRGSFRFSEKFKGKRVGDISELVNPGFIESEDASIMEIGGESEIVWSNITFSADADLKALAEKIGFQPNKTIISSQGEKFLLRIRPEPTKLLFVNCDLVRMDGIQFYYNYFGCLLIVPKEEVNEAFAKWLQDELRKLSNPPKPTIPIIIPGLNVSSPSVGVSLSRQLISLSSQPVRESVLDNFIRGNAEEFAIALGYKEAIPQVNLKIFDSDGNETGKSLKPDFLMKREDGYYDILDLKKALLMNYQSITKGDSKRRRFIDYVDELVAQLGGYLRYFHSESNRLFAKERGIEISNPKLIGIVGNHNNFSREEVDEAMTLNTNNLIILSYEELGHKLQFSN